MRRRFFAAAVFALGSILSAGCGGSDGNSPASSDSKQMTEFSITSPVQAEGNIDEKAKTVTVTVAYGTDLKQLVAVFKTTGVKTTIGDVEQVSGETQNDFSSPLKYTVTAQDKTTAVYTVTVSEAKSSACDITKFEIEGQSSSAVDSTEITVAMPFGADRKSLVPTITHTGAGISPASGAAQDFSGPVTYTVTAADSSTKKYTVTVNVAVNTAKEITKFTILGGNGTIDGTNIAVTVPYAADIKTLVPTIEITGESVSPASGTAQDFSSPVTYTVTAADTSKKEYTVTATNDAPSVEKPTLEKIAGTWERTYSETMTDSGTDVGTRTTKTVFSFNSDGTFTQVDKIVKDYTEADGRTDTTAYNAFKGTVSANDTAVTCVLTGKFINSPTEIIDLSAVTWDTYNVIKTFPAIIIEGTLYAENIVFQRTGTGTGLLGEWTCETRKGSTVEGASYGGEKSIYTFTDSVITGKMQSKDTADGDWVEDMSVSGTYTLSDGPLLTITLGSMKSSFAVFVTGDYFILGTDKGYSRK